MGGSTCKAKIVLDGGNGARLVESVCETVQSLSDEQIELLTDEAAYPIIKKLNKIEDLAIEAQKMLIKIIDYDGPLPGFLKGEGEHGDY